MKIGDKVSMSVYYETSGLGQLGSHIHVISDIVELNRKESEMYTTGCNGGVAFRIHFESGECTIAQRSDYGDWCICTSDDGSYDTFEGLEL